MMEQAQIKSSSKPSASAMHRHLLQRKCACGGTPGVSGACEGCCKDRMGFTQQLAIAPLAPIAVPLIAHEGLNSLGQPLDRTPGTSNWKHRFCHDFSQMKVDAGAKTERLEHGLQFGAYPAQGMADADGAFTGMGSSSRHIDSHSYRRKANGGGSPKIKTPGDKKAKVAHPNYRSRVKNVKVKLGRAPKISLTHAGGTRNASECY